MTAALFILGCAFLAIAALFFWLNLNSPIQTCIPAVAGPIGIILLLIDLGRLSL